jgi:hypothetical protein
VWVDGDAGGVRGLADGSHLWPEAGHSCLLERDPSPRPFGPTLSLMGRG